jgi:putative transposase
MLRIFPAGPEGNVKPLLQPWQLLMLVLAGWINRQQQEVIEYLVEENRVLRKKVGKKRVLLTADPRLRLGVKGKVLGRKLPGEFASIACPETILRRNRELEAENWDYSRGRKKAGRPAIPQEIVDLVVKLAKENPGWGYNRIQGAVGNPGHSISDTAIGKILRAHGIEPAPERKHVRPHAVSEA